MKLLAGVKLHDDQRRRLEQVAPGLELVGGDRLLMNFDEVSALLEPDTEILYTFRVPRDLLDRSPSIRWLQLLSAGCDYLLDSPVMRSDVKITTGSGIHAIPIAEHVLAMILALYRRLPETMAAQSRREWLDRNEVVRKTRELRGRTVGIVGYGSIGREVARLAKPFGTTILAMKRDPARRSDAGYTVEDTGDPAGSIPEKFYGPDRLMEMLPECDVVVVAVPLVEETRGMIGRRELNAMKPGSFIINIARGEVIDEAALIEALKEGPLGGAGLDVFDHEPLEPESELWGLNNAILTPHVSGGSRPIQRRAFEVLIENLGRYTRGDPFLNLVDRDQGY